MAESEIHAGKTSRKLVPYAGAALLVAGTVGFVLQYSIKGGDQDYAQQRALKEREKIEAAQLTGKVVTEDAARKDIEAKTAAAKEELDRRKRDRDAILTARPTSGLPPPPPPPSPAGLINDESMRQYEAAKIASAPGSKEASTMVAYEEFPGAKKNFASVVQDQATLPPKDGEQQQAPQSASADEDKNVAWAAKTGTRVKAGTADFLKPEAPVGKSILQQGTVINAVTRTAINTRLPGQIVAMVTQDVYDSISGDTLLLPKGSRLIGEYNTSIMEGQNRVMMAFTRLILPTGVSVKLGAMSASDALGMAGAKGKLNTYFFKRLGSSLLIALMADRINQPSGGVTIINTGQAASSTTAAGEVLSKMATAELERSAKITPDITLAQGAKVTLILAADLALPPSITQKTPTEE